MALATTFGESGHTSLHIINGHLPGSYLTSISSRPKQLNTCSILYKEIQREDVLHWQKISIEHLKTVWKEHTEKKKNYSVALHFSNYGKCRADKNSSNVWQKWFKCIAKTIIYIQMMKR